MGESWFNMISINDIIDVLVKNNQLVDINISDHNKIIEHLCDNSNDAKENSLLFCKGKNFKEKYLVDSIDSGISFYLADDRNLYKFKQGLLVKDIKISISIVASLFYKNPQDKLKIIGITGTKGKTSTVFMLKKIIDNYLKDKSTKCGLISSIENYDGRNYEVAHLSTPEPLQLIQKLHSMVENNCEYCIMEVSSQALKYNRVYSINFFISCFTNIGEDHISDIEHSSFEDYFSSKLKIVDKSDKVLINSEIETTKQDNMLIFDYNGLDANADYVLANLESNVKFSKFKVNNEEFCINLFGEFNAYNAFSAIALSMEIGIPTEYIKEALKNIVVPGRVEFFENKKEEKVFIVDYAHNKLSYEVLFENVKKQYPNYKIITIFGCPGEKALTRRKDLPEISEKYSDYIYITEEDYGNEPLEKICSEIFFNIKNKNIAEIEYDREVAIKKAFMKFRKEVVILVLGKGREKTQKRMNIYEDVLSDIEIVKNYTDN